RLAVFAGGATLDALQQVGNAEAVWGSSLLDNLTTLVNHSLIHREDPRGRGDDFADKAIAGDRVRVGMLETIREYAWERLRAAGEERAAQHMHAHYFLALAERAEPELERANQASWLAQLEQDHANLRAALQWAREQKAIATGLRLAGALWRFWYQR